MSEIGQQLLVATTERTAIRGASERRATVAVGPLAVVGVTIPPWPGPDEAIFVDGAWPAAV